MILLYISELFGLSSRLIHATVTLAYFVYYTPVQTWPTAGANLAYYSPVQTWPTLRRCKPGLLYCRCKPGLHYCRCKPGLLLAGANLAYSIAGEHLTYSMPVQIWLILPPVRSEEGYFSVRKVNTIIELTLVAPTDSDKVLAKTA